MVQRSNKPTAFKQKNLRFIDIVVFLVLTISTTVAILRFKHLKFENRIIATLLIATFPQAVICYILAHQSTNNLLVVELYSILEFLLMMLYYYKLLYKTWFRSIIVLFTGVGIMWFAGVLFGKKPFLHAYSFIFFEAFTIVVTGSFYCLHLLLKGSFPVTRLSSFWITLTILLYWTTTYTWFGLMIFGNQVMPSFISMFEYFFLTANIIFYVSMSFILYNYKRFVGDYE